MLNNYRSCLERCPSSNSEHYLIVGLSVLSANGSDAPDYWIRSFEFPRVSLFRRKVVKGK